MKKRIFRQRYNTEEIKEKENDKLIDYSNIDKMKKEELLEICEKLNKDISNARTKKELIEIIKGE